MQSVYGQQCVPSEVYVWQSLSILNARMGLQIQVYAKQAQHNLSQRMRVRKDPKEPQGDPGCSSRTSSLHGKTSAYSCPGSFLVL